MTGLALTALLVAVVAIAAAVLLMRQAVREPDLSVTLTLDVRRFAAAMQALARAVGDMRPAADRAVRSFHAFGAAMDLPAPPRPLSRPVLAFELAAARHEARMIVREGLRRVAPAAVAQVEVDDLWRVRRLALEHRLAMEAGLRVVDPASMVRGAFPL